MVHKTHHPRLRDSRRARCRETGTPGSDERPGETTSRNADTAPLADSYALHHIRDVTYREDHSQICTGSGPAVMAALRSFAIAIAILKFCGWTNIAKANRHHHKNPRRCLATLGLTNRHQGR